MYDGMNLYRAVVSYASATTGDISVRIPAILGPTEVLPVSKIGRAAVNGTWEVPLLGSQVVVAIEDDRFSNVYMVYPNLAVIQAAGGGEGGGGGGEEPPPEEGQSVPSGAIMQFGGSAAPTGWLLCDGDTVSQTLYAALYTAIGDAYAVGGEPTGEFRLPNLKGRVPVGFDAVQTEFNIIGLADGDKTRALITGNLPEHNHSLNNHTHSLNSHTHTIGHGHTASGSGSSSGSGHSHTISGGRHQHNLSTGAALSIGAANSLFANSGNPPVIDAGTTKSNDSTSDHSHTVSGGSHSHTVTVTVDDLSASSTSGAPSQASTAGPSTTNTGNAGSASPTAFEILQPYLVVNYIIKV